MSTFLVDIFISPKKERIEMNLRNKLESIKEFKRNYYVGTANALTYMRAVDRYQALADLVRTETNGTIKLSFRQMASFICFVRVYLCFLFNSVSATNSTVKDFSMLSQHEVLSWHETDTSGFKQHVWHIDESEFVRTLLGAQKNLTVKLFTTPSMIGKAILNVKEKKLYKRKGLDKSFSLEDIVKTPSLRSLNLNTVWEEVESILNYRFEPVAGLQEAFEQEDLQKAHDCLLPALSSDAVYHLTRVLEDPPHIGTQTFEEEEELYGSESFSRFKREKVLGRIEYERRIALNLVHSSNGNLPLSEERLDQIISTQKERVKKALKQFKMFEGHAPRPIVEGNKRSLDRARYQYLSLKNNRRWLLRMYSN